MIRVAVAAVTLLGVPAAPAVAARACGLDGDLRYAAADVSGHVTVDLVECDAVGKVGRVTMRANVVRRDLLTGAETVTPVAPVRCAATARKCSIRARVRHEATDVAEYELAATYRSDGRKRFVAGTFSARIRCAAAGGVYLSCGVPEA